MGFSGESDGGSYHSIYDSFDFYERFGDPGFHYGITLAKVTGRVMLRTAEADLLPYDLGRLVDTIDRYAKEVTKLADDTREETAEQNRLIKDGSLVAAADPTKTYIPPAAKEPVPFLNFAPLQNAVAKLRESVRSEEAARSAAFSAGKLSEEKRASLDRSLAKLEQGLLREEGLPRRPWYRHLLYAPGFYTGYGVKTLPGVREAIEQRRWKEAEEQIGILAAALERTADEVNRIKSAL
jgi:N-acetylated-alpha-linked acidic dipeptidase